MCDTCLGNDDRLAVRIARRRAIRQRSEARADLEALLLACRLSGALTAGDYQLLLDLIGRL